jgi:UDP-glucose:(heptosyl)LPS alpha-1,3-glucosyltransferase
LENRCFKNAKRIIANSNMVKNEIINTYDINPANISVVYNGIELKESNYKKSFNKLSKEFKIKPNNPVLMHVGSGFKRKGVEEFLQIIAKLNNPNIIGFIVGKEKKINHYLQLARDLSIDEQVIFTGSRKDVDDFYTISDIFLFSTHYEPFSNVILEAMSFDNVVFTTKQNGASEILDDEFLMEHPNDFSVVNKINNLLNHPNLLEEVKSRNKLIVKQFSIDNNLIKTMDVIRSVMHE